MMSLRDWSVFGLLLLLTITCLGIIVFDEVTGHPIDQTIQTLLAFVVGVLSRELFAQKGNGKQGQNGAPPAQ